MIIYNGNIISDGLYHEDGNPYRWLSPQVGRYTRVYEPGNVVINDMWSAGNSIRVGTARSYIEGTLGFTGPVEVYSNVSWLTPRFEYCPPGQMFCTYHSGLTSQYLLNGYRDFERKSNIKGIYTDDTPYFPVSMRITVSANSGSSSRSGTIGFRKLGTSTGLYPYRSGNEILVPYTIIVTQDGTSTVVNYGSLTVSRYQDLASAGLPSFTHRVFSINVGGIKTLTLDTRSVAMPHTFNDIRSGTYSIAVTGSGYTSMGQTYKLNCTASPSTVTIPVNGSTSIVINVSSAHM